MIKVSKPANICVNRYSFDSKQRRAIHPNPLRDGSEKAEGFPRGARETKVVRYKSLQLGVVGSNA
jgi:hypothetical protein